METEICRIGSINGIVPIDREYMIAIKIGSRSWGIDGSSSLKDAEHTKLLIDKCIEEEISKIRLDVLKRY